MIPTPALLDRQPGHLQEPLLGAQKLPSPCLRNSQPGAGSGPDPVSGFGDAGPRFWLLSARRGSRAGLASLGRAAVLDGGLPAPPAALRLQSPELHGCGRHVGAQRQGRRTASLPEPARKLVGLTPGSRNDRLNGHVSEDDPLPCHAKSAFVFFSRAPRPATLQRDSAEDLGAEL
ncbi:UNVERIFIED_CONTAM: hypothetical protein K2H54_051722 [Gekko kuhli]